MIINNKTQADIGYAIAEILPSLSTSQQTLTQNMIMKKARTLAEKAWHLAYFDGAHTAHLIHKVGFVDIIDGDSDVPAGFTIVL